MLLGKIASNVHRRLLVDVGAFTPHHAYPGIAVEVVFVVLSAVVYKKIFLLRHQLEDVVIAKLEKRRQLYS